MAVTQAEENAELAAFAEAYKVLLNRSELMIRVSAPDAYWLMAALQLAWRHPGMAESVKRSVWTVGHVIMEGLALDGLLLEVAEKGWDPEEDR